MKYRTYIFVALGLLLVLWGEPLRARDFSVSSPDGRLTVCVKLADKIYYTVKADGGETLLDSCWLSLVLPDEVLGRNPKLRGVSRQELREELKREIPLKNALVKNHCNLLRMQMAGDYAVEFRVYDNGLAYRFVTARKGELEVVDEECGISLPADSRLHLSQTGSFKTSYEEPYTHLDAADYSPKAPMTYLPVLAETAGGYKILISEADLRDYPCMFLRGTGGGGLQAVFPKCPLEFGPDGDRSVSIVREADYIAKTSGRRSFPWRFMVISRDDREIVANEMVYCLSAPCELDDCSWIKPGQVSWEWWHDARLFGVPFRSGYNMDSYKYYIDFASRFGIPYIIMDEGWAKSTLDPFTPNPDIDLQELIRYGQERGVKIVLWLTWLTVENHFDLFETFARWGVAGVKIDFMDRSDQWMVNFYERVAREAAKHQLFVDFHGAFKPAGLERRFPNVLSYEGVRGMEQGAGCRPDNTIYLPFMRNAVGPMDFTPGSMFSAQPEDNRSTRANAMGSGTRAYQMALFVLFESGLQMLADNPVYYYRERPCTEFITRVPVCWDETRVLQAKVGEYVVMARRSADGEWFLGAITNNRERELEVDLSFLPDGQKWLLTSFEDGINADRQAMDYRRQEREVTRTDRLVMKLARNGGWAGRLTPAAQDTILPVGADSPCCPVRLMCEHLVCPLGIDNPAPRLSWQLADERPGACQTAYRLVVGTDSLAVLGGKGDEWDTGRQLSERQLVAYSGRSLRPFTRYYWRVETWDADGQPAAPSAVHAFETGMMDMGNWQGAWISDEHDIHYKPAPYFRKRFSTSKKVRSARAYIAAAGLYELYLNGTRIGDHRLDPLYTRFDRRNYYVTYDVTPYLQAGDNAVGILLGNGWYNHQSMAVWDFHRAPWRNRPAFCLDLRITYEDGTVETVCSERDWKTSSGPLLFNSIYTAEHYDARLEQKDWATAAFDDAAWQGVRYRSVPSSRVTAQQARPIRAVDTLSVQSMNRLDSCTYVFDFGQNMAGVTRIRVAGTEGTVLRLKHGERLAADGRVDLSNIDVYHRPTDDSDPFQTDILVLSGKGEDDFTARFNYKGFRYVEVTASTPVELTPANLTAYFVHSDVPSCGHIHTSSPFINRLWQATNRSYLSNLMGYPTDCPQREKNGWTGDGHFAIETALYNFDAITVYEKWMADHRDEQQPNGVLPDIIPTGGWGYGTDNGTDWTSTIAIIPWNLYLFYGDVKPLADCYEHIRRYVDYIDRSYPSGLTTWGRGDWVPVSVPSDKELTSSVYFYTDATILAHAAQLLGRTDDHRRYAALADKIRRAINDKFLDRERGIYASGTQTELCVPLKWGIVPEELRAKVADNLNRKVVEAGYHLDVGVLGAKALLDALTENGYARTAWRVASQDTYPSWGHWIANGATTLHENWDMQATRDISDNHMMFGEIGAWFYKGLAGLYPDPECPGFKHILLRPNCPEGLKQFEASFGSPYGEVRVRWERKGSRRVHYTVRIPAGSSATFSAPAGMSVQTADGRMQVCELSAGEHLLKLVED